VKTDQDVDHRFVYRMFLRGIHGGGEDILRDEILLFFLDDYAMGDFKVYVQDLVRIRNESYGRKYARYQRAPNATRPTFKHATKV
jgi:hypothetical protein